MSVESESSAGAGSAVTGTGRQCCTPSQFNDSTPTFTEGTPSFTASSSSGDLGESHYNNDHTGKYTLNIFWGCTGSGPTYFHIYMNCFDRNYTYYILKNS